MTLTVRLFSITMDREGAHALLLRSDGKMARVPGNTALSESTALASLQWFPGVGLIGSTGAGDDIAFETPELGQFADAESRVSIYLDQKDWRYLTIALDPKSDASNQDREDAQQLQSWIKDRAVILPISSGHYLETTKWSVQDLRYSLGLTMLQLSRGWQMRDPIQVRRNELFDAFRQQAARSVPRREGSVITLHPNTLQESRAKPLSPLSDLDPEAALHFAWLVTSSSMIEVMLDQDHIPAAKHEGWETTNQAFSDWLDRTERNPDQKRRSVDVLFLQDIQTELAEEARAAGITPEQMTDWLHVNRADGIAAMPATGLYRELLYSRHLSLGYRWRHGDLVDMLFLSCAAGYCDVVVCERSTAAILAGAQKRLKRHQTVFRDLHAAMPEITRRVAERGIREQP